MKQQLLWVWTSLLAASAMLLPPTPALAAISHPYISEVAWGGSSLSGSDEWIELYNPSTQTIALNGWKLTNAASSGEDLPLDGLSLLPQHTLLIANYATIHENSALAHEPDLVTASLSLKNSQLYVALVDDTGTIVDEAGDGSGTGAAGASGDSPVSMQRLAGATDGTLDASWTDASQSIGFKEGRLDLGTPGTHTQTPTETDAPEPNESPTDDEEPTEAEPTTETTEEPVEESESAEVTYRDATQQSQRVTISEIYPSPRPDEHQWVELYNPTEHDIDLTGWLILDQSGNVESVFGDIDSLSYSTVEIPRGFLGRRGDIVKVMRSDGTFAAAAAYTDTVPTGSSLIKQGQRMEVTRIPSPGKKEAEETHALVPTLRMVSFQPTTIRLMELLPNATGTDSEEEYMTLENFGDTAINLNGWSIQDASGDTWLMNGILEANSIQRFMREETGITLNNNTEALTLYAPSHVVVDQVAYTKTRSGIALERANHWQLPESEPTPKAPKPRTRIRSTHFKAQSVRDARNETKGTRVSTTGIVSVTPGTFGKQYFYIADEDAGMQIYLHSSTFPNLSVGDEVRVQGEISEARGEKRLKLKDANDITVLSKDNAVPIQTITLNEVDEPVEGAAVSVTAQVEAARSDELILVKDGMRVTVRLTQASSAQSGDTVTVAGIVRESNGEYSLHATGSITVTEKEREPFGASAGTTFTAGPTIPPQTYGMGIVSLALGGMTLLYMHSRKHLALETR